MTGRSRSLLEAGCFPLSHVSLTHLLRPPQPARLAPFFRSGGPCRSLSGFRRGEAPRVPSRPPGAGGQAAGGMWRLVPPKLGRLSRSLKLAALGSLLVLMVLHSPSLLAPGSATDLADRRFLQLNKCPACFGAKLVPPLPQRAGGVRGVGPCACWTSST